MPIEAYVGRVWSDLQGSVGEIGYLKKILTYVDRNGFKHLQYRSKPNFSIRTGLVPHLQQTTALQFNIHDPSNLLLPDHNAPPVITEMGQYTLRGYQEQTAKRALFWRRALIECVTGSGKTLIAASIFRSLLEAGKVKSCLFLVSSKALLDQAYEDFKRAGFSKVGKIGGGSKNGFGSAMTIALPFSLKACDALENIDIFVCDEVQHLKAATYKKIIEQCLNAPYRLGMSATVWDNPLEIKTKAGFNDLTLIGYTGPLRAKVPGTYLRQEGYLADPKIILFRVDEPKVRSRDWQEVYTEGHVDNPILNDLAISLTNHCYKAGRKVLILVAWVEKHGVRILRALDRLNIPAKFLTGQGKLGEIVKRKVRWKTINLDDLRKDVNEHERYVLIGSPTADEGVDFPSMNVLVMLGGMKKYRRTVQRLGRVLRPQIDGQKVYVFDFDNRSAWFLQKHSWERIQTYREEDYELSTDFQSVVNDLGIPYEPINGIYQ